MRSVVAGRVPVIVHVSMPGTDQAVDLARHAEKIGADCVIAIAPYYWKPSQEGLYEHFAAIMSATDLPFVAYSSPTIMDGIGISPATLVKLMERFPQIYRPRSRRITIGKKYLELGKAAKTVRPDFGLFVGTEWMIRRLTLGGTACMSIFGGIAPRFVQALYDATTDGRLKDALELQYKFSELYQIAKVEYPAPTKAMWEIMGGPWVHRGCQTGRYRRTEKGKSGPRSNCSDFCKPSRMAGRSLVANVRREQNSTAMKNALGVLATTVFGVRHGTAGGHPKRRFIDLPAGGDVPAFARERLSRQPVGHPVGQQDRRERAEVRRRHVADRVARSW